MKKIALWFGAGVISTNIYFLLKSCAIWFFVGSPIVCQSSFPRYHDACIYSRFGIGEQAITFEIDGKSVFFSSDLAGGDLKERIVWDQTGRFATFYIDGFTPKTYNADTRELIDKPKLSEQIITQSVK